MFRNAFLLPPPSSFFLHSFVVVTAVADVTEFEASLDAAATAAPAAESGEGESMGAYFSTRSIKGFLGGAKK